MRGCAALRRLSLCCCLLACALRLALLPPGAAAEEEDEVGEAPGETGSPAALPSLIPRARCAARCLGLQVPRMQPQSDGSLTWCQQHKECAKCLEPCKETRDLNTHQCHNYCETLFPGRGGFSECVSSCEFVSGALRVKQGTCPSPGQARGFAAACVESCGHDRDCAGARRCCTNGCGHTCQVPRHPYRGVPLRPRRALRVLPQGAGRLQVRWSSRFNVSMEPVLYLLQWRWSHGPHPGQEHYAPWSTVAQTTEEHVELSDIRPGRWYQFRVAAINTHGTRGFTPPSPHFRSPQEPSPPLAPSGLRLSSASLAGEDGGMAVSLAWDPPTPDPDLPVHHYRVTWTTDSGKRSRKTADGHFPTLLLDGLHPGMLYSVELQAVAHWGPTRLRSPKARLRFRTVDPAQLEPLGKLRHSVEVGLPFLQDGNLQVMVHWRRPPGLNASLYHVEWTPRVCEQNHNHNWTGMPGPWAASSTQHQHLTLPGLSFSCSYRVWVQPVVPGLNPEPQVVDFSTPACEALARSGQGGCPGNPGPHKKPPHPIPPEGH